MHNKTPNVAAAKIGKVKIILIKQKIQLAILTILLRFLPLQFSERKLQIIESEPMIMPTILNKKQY